MQPMSYVGRFAPSPTGPLHAGSLVAALASWLDAAAQAGRWLVRIEDIDSARCQNGAAERIMGQLAAHGLLPDAVPLYQSSRSTLYQRALDHLIAEQQAYPCSCTRQEIARALASQGYLRQRHKEQPYPGICRSGLHGRPARAWRFRNMGADVHWTDRRLGPQWQDVARHVGDFVLRRADNLWAYQLAVVVDDGAQGITHIVRGEDLADNTPRQLLLQAALGLPAPRYLHTPLVRAPNGEKLSKQHGAPPIDERYPLLTLNAAARVLGLPWVAETASIGEALACWVAAWAQLYNPSCECTNRLPSTSH